jgi:methionyl aminopeptidase
MPAGGSTATAVLPERPDSIRPGVIGLTRTVPATIERPPYADSGQPPPHSDDHVRSPDAIERMRRTGALAAEALIVLGEAVEVAMTTDKLDELCHQFAIDHDAYPSPLNYRGFPKSLCTSVNEVICHGIPDSRQLEDGDIINLDVTFFREGVHGDTSATFLVGDVDDASRRLIDETRTCLAKGIAAVAPGVPLNEIGRAIKKHAEGCGLGVVREFIGHGIGENFHTALQIPHYYEPSANTIIEEGMTFTIEPMITLGSPALHMWDDDWTVVTNDRDRSAQFEHMLVVEAGGAHILTQTTDGRTAADTAQIA